MRHYTKYERETIIIMNDAESIAYVSSAQKHQIARLQKLAKDRPDDVKVVKETEDYIEVTCPRKYIKITPPRQMTEEQKEQARQRLLAYRAGKTAGGDDALSDEDLDDLMNEDTEDESDEDDEEDIDS